VFFAERADAYAGIAKIADEVAQEAYGEFNAKADQFAVANPLDQGKIDAAKALAKEGLDDGAGGDAAADCGFECWPLRCRRRSGAGGR
jgi:hypothetical protein